MSVKASQPLTSFIQKILVGILVVFFLLCFMTACQSGSGQATEESTSELSTEVGSIVSLPATPTKNSVIFTLTEEDSEQSQTPDAEAAFNCVPATTTGDAFGNIFIPETQMCPINKADFTLGVLALYFTSCADASGVESHCDPLSIHSVAERATLYDGTQVSVTQIDLRVSELQNLFPADVTAFGDFSGFRAGGLQVVTAYIGHIFPDATSHPDEAKAVASYLQGKAYRVCTTPSESVDSDTMLTRCGQAEAEEWDLLVDLDGDGHFGFLDVTLLSQGYGVESDTRPENYSQYRNHFLHQIFPTDDVAKLLSTNETFYGTTGYVAPIFPFEDIAAIEENDDRNLLVQIHQEGSLRFMDGGRAAWEKGSVAIPDDDAETPGLYDPYFDLFPFIKLPNASVIFVEPSL